MARANRRKNYHSVDFEGSDMEISKDSLLTVSDELGDMENAPSDEIPEDAIERFDNEGGSFIATPPLKNTVFGIPLPHDAVHHLHRLKRRALAARGELQKVIEEQKVVVADSLQSAYEQAKTQAGALNEHIKEKPYLYAAGAVVAGFAIGRIYLSKKSGPDVKVQ